MKPKAITFILLVSLVLCGKALAQNNDQPASEPLILTDEQGKYPLGLHMDLFEDPSGELTIEDVSSSAFTSQFTPSRVSIPIFGFTKSVIWVRLRFNNQALQTNFWLLEIGYPNTQYVDLYSPSPNGEGFSEKQSGALRPPSTRDILFPRIIFRLAIPTQSQQTYYLRFQSGASMTLPLTLWAQSAFLNNALEETTLLVLFYGVLIGLLVYNIFLLISLREVSYLYLVLFLASFTFYLGSYDGFNEIYLIPNLYYLKPYYNPLSFVLAFVSVILFAENVLELKVRLPFFHRIMVIFLAGWAILMLLIPFTSYLVVARSMLFWALLLNILLLVAGSILWKKGFTPVRFFMIAWVGLLASLCVIFLVRFGFIPSTPVTENSFRLGLVWMAVWWSLTLANRVNLLRAETESANRNLRNSEHRLSQILESLPLGVVLYGKDYKPQYANRRAVEILSNPAQGIKPDISAGRTLEQAIQHNSLDEAGSHNAYPESKFPVFNALHGETSYIDNVEMDKGDMRVSLEFLASPVRDEAGNIESAVSVLQDITERKRVESELDEHRKHLEELVVIRTADLNVANEKLHLRNEWLSAVNKIHPTISGTASLLKVYEELFGKIHQLLHTPLVFILRWDKQSEQPDLFYFLQQGEGKLDGEKLKASFQKDSLLRREIELGNIITWSPDQSGSLPVLLEDCFQEHDIRSSILVPMMIQQSIFGVLGVGVTKPAQDVIHQQLDLVERMAFDIASITQDAILLDQALALAMVDERNHLARDLHDSVTQVLFSASLLAEVLPQIWQRDPEQGFQKLEKLRQLTRGALAEMRTMLLELRPSAVLNISLSDLLVQLAEAVTSRTGLPFQLFIEQSPNLPENVQISFYRIAQEALNNIVKHAQAKLVTISLSATPLTPSSTGGARHEIQLLIRDDGVGFFSGNGQSTRLGIGIMKERAAAIQANLSLESRPGYGTEVILIWSGETGSIT